MNKVLQMLIVMLSVGFGYVNGTEVESSQQDINDELIVAAGYGSIQRVQQLLQMGADLNVQDRKKRTPLMWAVYNGHLKW